jgi:hypothetical protein
MTDEMIERAAKDCFREALDARDRTTSISECLKKLNRFHEWRADELERVKEKSLKMLAGVRERK